MKSIKIVLMVLVVQALIVGCASVNLQKSDKDYTKDIQRLKQALLKSPQDPDVLRDLGAVYFQMEQYTDARESLLSAYKIRPRDGKTLLYMGLSLEMDNQPRNALQIYERYPQISRFSPYRRLVEGRYQWVQRNMAKQEAKQLLLNPESMTDPDAEALAIFPMLYEGSETSKSKYGPLGLGLSEMMVVDLGKVPSLKLVERTRVQELIKEINLGQSKYVDPNTSPRHGQLLGAGKIVGGVLNVVDDRRLNVSMSYWDVGQSQTPAVSDKGDLLDNLFRLEKALVFEIIGRMGIRLTPEERAKILVIPTKNLQAFLAYCLGLQKENEGLYLEARSYFNRATKIDPRFNLARSASHRADGLSAADFPKEQMSEQAQKIDNDANKLLGQGGSMVDTRLKKISRSIGSNFEGGEDTRTPLGDTFGSGAGLGELPEPPPPPQ